MCVLCRQLLLKLLYCIGNGDDGVKAIMAQPFFSSIDWSKLMSRKVSPPFKPIASRADDTFYFDSEFTLKTPKG